METGGRDIQKQFSEITASRLLIPSLPLLRKSMFPIGQPI